MNLHSMTRGMFELSNIGFLLFRYVVDIVSQFKVICRAHVGPAVKCLSLLTNSTAKVYSLFVASRHLVVFADRPDG
jgi:hypothetical protein